MAGVHRNGFTELFGSESARNDPYRVKYEEIYLVIKGALTNST